MSLADQVQAVRALHAEIDHRTAEFARQAELSCPPGCGRCCENPDIQVTVLDCLPLAAGWVQAGLADEWHERLLRLEAAPGSACPFYRSAISEIIPGRTCATVRTSSGASRAQDGDPTAAGIGRGQCTQYEQRMSLCRLFGYAAVRSKSGEARIAHCAEHKSSWQPPAGISAESLAELAPLFSDYSMRLSGLEPRLGTVLLPAAKAARLALEHIVLRAPESRPNFPFQEVQGHSLEVNTL